MRSSKWIQYTMLMIVFAAGSLLAQDTSAQDSTGLPGDNFSLEGALEMFRKSESPEEFEKLINTQDNNVNNLDLNGDGDIDYVKVIDRKEGDAHAIILRAAVSETEDQDVAVIEVEKKGNEEAVLQIVGDEDLYGNEVIVEPAPAQAVNPVVVNVWAWPAVRYVYRPSYVVWASPWGWRAHPVWWRPWRPVGYRVFYPYRAPYRHHYVVVHSHRVVYAHRVYTPYRTTSVIVHNRHQPAVTNYRATHTRVVQGNSGNRVRTTRTTTVDRGRKANTRTRTTRTTTKGRRRGN